jgi:hypothetical protein
MMMAKMMPTLALLIFQMNLRVLFFLQNWAFQGLIKSFPTVFEVKRISPDTGISREIALLFPLSRDFEFSGKWENPTTHLNASSAASSHSLSLISLISPPPPTLQPSSADRFTLQQHFLNCLLGI